MQSGDELVDILAVEAALVDVLGYYLADEVFPRAGPAMQGQGQRLLWVGVVQESGDGFHDHPLHQVLAEELPVQVVFKRWEGARKPQAEKRAQCELQADSRHCVSTPGLSVDPCGA